ncbi:MAG: amino acid ABC transporter ATP-binding protein [Erysipelotrichaceae bacterium]|nr:amino acid ABC transporter ATP-binding protein [Erysipelotrichaceae bacterium]
MIRVKDLHKAFDGQEIIKGVSFDINKGDVIAIIGPSGAGKTTILRCINYLVKADSGKIEIDGMEYDLADMKRKDIARLREKTGFVFQNYNLFLNMTVLGNVMEPLTVVRKVEKSKARQMATEALTKVGMADKLDSYPSQLSGGQQQRVAIARALVYSPDVIYFDEPTSALDPELISEVLNVMKDLAQTGITMVVVTHEMSFARNVSNKILFMENGVIVEEASSKDFFENPKNERAKQFVRSITER